MGGEELGRPFVFYDHKFQRLESKLPTYPGRPLRCIGENAVTRRYHGRFLHLCVSDSKVIKRISRCLTDEQRERIRNNQVVPVVGYDEEGKKWKLKLREEKKIINSNSSISYIFEMEMPSECGCEMEGISIWGFPYGRSGDPFVFTC